MQPKLTIVTVTYNCVDSLTETMESVFSQTYPHVEYLLIDGGSTDGTVERIKEQEGRIAYWVSEPDKGIFDAMNKGIEKATGAWINFMNAGDRLASPRVLEEIFSQEIDPSVGCIYGQTLNVTPDGQKKQDVYIPFYRNSRYFRGMGFNHQSVFVRTDLARRFRFDLSFKVAADYQMMNQIFCSGAVFREVPQIISEVDVTGFSVQNRALQRYEEARISGCEHDVRFLLWTRYMAFRSWVKSRLPGRWKTQKTRKVVLSSPRRKKLVHLLWGLPVGGVENMLVDIVNRQVRQHEVHIFVINDLFDKELLLRIDSRCKVHFMGRTRGSKSPVFALRMNRLLLHIRPDIVHYHASELKRFVWLRAESVITIHNTHLPTAYYSDSDTLVAISKAVQEDVRKRSGFDSVLLENGVDVTGVQVRTDYTRKNFRLVQVGRLFHSQKGQDILISALEQLVYQEGMVQLRLDFIGEGDSQDYLEQLVAQKNLGRYISFLGKKDRTFIYAHLKDYDLFVQPSRYEGFGLTVVEAMSARVPVLVSENEGPMEIIDGGRYGSFFKKEDPLDCARCIKEIVTHYPAENILEEARLHAARNYSIDRMVERYDEVYVRVSSGRK